MAKLKEAYKIDQARIEQEKAKRNGISPATPEEAAKLEPTILTPEATIALLYHEAHEKDHERKPKNGLWPA